LNTTFDLPLPHGVFGNLYNFSYPELAKVDYFNNSIFYKIGGDEGFVRDMEIQGFRTYNVDEVQQRNKTYTYLNMSEIGMKISPGNNSFIINF
jgi:hypothetical protein